MMSARFFLVVASTGEADAQDRRGDGARRPVGAVRDEFVLVQQDLQGDGENAQEGMKKSCFILWEALKQRFLYVSLLLL